MFDILLKSHYNTLRTIMRVRGLNPLRRDEMKLDLRDVIHVPNAEKSFQFQLDLSDLEFWGRKPITRPILVEGSVVNHAGALVLNGTARSELDLVCDRCGKEILREKVVSLDTLLATELEDEDNEDDYFLLDGNELDLDEVVTTTFVLAMDTKNLCSDDCKGLCAKCGADFVFGTVFGSGQNCFGRNGRKYRSGLCGYRLSGVARRLDAFGGADCQSGG